MVNMWVNIGIDKPQASIQNLIIKQTMKREIGSTWCKQTTFRLNGLPEVFDLK